jgi:hypothetical protein
MGKPGLHRLVYMLLSGTNRPERALALEAIASASHFQPC